jgi:hypothetical protein
MVKRFFTLRTVTSALIPVNVVNLRWQGKGGDPCDMTMGRWT